MAVREYDLDPEKTVVDVYTRHGSKWLGCDVVEHDNSNFISFWHEGAVVSIPNHAISTTVLREEG
tara:strand:+ start:141 stop:335 length:195 start_codon:yes stop_codon:yes gene_type:complete